MRSIWLKDPETGAIWDLLPKDSTLCDGGCALIAPAGFGYSQDVTQEQVEIDYFISQIKSKNQSITGTFYFNNDEHLQNFQKYVGDFRRQFLLYYSPSGEYEPYDEISSPYYKPVIISSIKKGEKSLYGYYECEATFSTQSDVWKRDIYLGIRGKLVMQGEPLVYPYIYPYVLGGRNLYAIEVQNAGRETGCKILIKNNAETPLTQIEWFVDHTYIDEYGVQHTETQRSKWYTENTTIALQKDYELYVDSAPTTQEAKVNYPNGISQSVVAWQEPSWEYINFVRIKHGFNRFVFYIESQNVDIGITYQEQKELI